MLENLKDYASPGQGMKICKVASIRKDLDAKDLEILDSAFADKEGFSVNSLYQGLNALGITIGYNAIAKHRRNLCTCGRSNA